MVSADVFGTIIRSGEDAQAVGQDYGEMARHLDYLCPMTYLPSRGREFWHRAPGYAALRHDF